MNGAFSWGVLRGDVVQPGMSEEDARKELATSGGRLVKVQYIYPNGDVAK